ncbi:helix-turn-helix transcriptional regulator [Lacticaseibacillus porcinae]|uniref:helix-turn-helix transcriptional regulator n=1 Tax=Lacticaseibacillus porcinae TaxID=1123687 RepID=UPI0013DDD936|nr:helix-turn-helix transcriptional regulator [Lacticaseibacillus porcinae]
MLAQAHLGAYFKQLRLDQNLSRQALAKRLNFSEKTLQRIEAGIVDLKVTQCFALVNYFALTPQNLEPAVAELTPQKVFAKINRTNDYLALAEQFQLLAKTRRLPWLADAALVCQALAAQNTGDQQQAIESAQRFAQHFLQRNHRSELCFHLLTKVAPLLPMTTLTQLAASGIFDEAIQSPALINDALIFQWCWLQQAIANQKLTDLTLTCQMVLQALNAIQTPESQILTRFCKVIQRRLNNQPQHAQRQLSALENAITLLFPEGKARWVITRLQATDHHLMQRLACYRPYRSTAMN